MLWTRASLRDPEVSVAFYEPRLAAAPGELWQSILAWNEARGYALQTVWPKQELERLRPALDDR